MLSDIASSLTDPAYLVPILVSVAVFATLFTLMAPYFERGDLDARMKSAALERDEIRAREPASTPNRRAPVKRAPACGPTTMPPCAVSWSSSI